MGGRPKMAVLLSRTDSRMPYSRSATIALCALLCTSCASEPERTTPPQASELSPFSQQLAYCEAVSLFMAEFLRDRNDLVAARIGLERWSKLLTANAWLNAEDSEVSRDTYRRFEDASAGQREIWTINPALAITADEACDSYVEEGWMRAEASETDEVDGKAMEEWRKDVYDMAKRRVGLYP
jgi:hypothetical protein